MVIKQTDITEKVIKPKTPFKKIAAKPVKKVSALSAPVYSLAGKELSVLELPVELFGAKINLSLLKQAIRVYNSNQKSHWGNTKTRGEVVGSTRKIYKQKGTGRARHGSVMAPIFVGGGIALGPKSRKVVLGLSKSMKKAALVSALSQKALDQEIIAIDGLDQASGKTKEIVVLMKTLGKKSALITADKPLENVLRAINNLSNVKFLPADQINTFEVIKYQSLVLTKKAVDKLSTHLLAEKVSKQDAQKEAKAG